MRKKSICIVSVSLIVAFAMLAGGCDSRAKLSSTAATSNAQSSESTMGDTKDSSSAAESESTKESATSQTVQRNAEYKDLDVENEWILMWAKVGTQINDLGDVYEIKNVCLTKTVNYEYDVSMFENVKIGDEITLPNGIFTLIELDMGENGKIEHAVVENDYYWQQFSFSEDMGVMPIGIGEYIQLENVYIGDVYVAKDAVYSKMNEYDPDDYTDITFREGIVEDSERLQYGFFVSLLDMDEDGVVKKVEEPFIP